jgi:hypothetical protein
MDSSVLRDSRRGRKAAERREADAQICCLSASEAKVIGEGEGKEKKGEAEGDAGGDGQREEEGAWDGLEGSSWESSYAWEYLGTANGWKRYFGRRGCIIIWPMI